MLLFEIGFSLYFIYFFCIKDKNLFWNNSRSETIYIYMVYKNMPIIQHRGKLSKLKILNGKFRIIKLLYVTFT